MNCQECIDSLNTYLDRELSTAEIQQVHVHLEFCPPCGKYFHFEEGVRRLVRRSCSAERAPDALRQRLGQALRENR